MAEEFAHLTIMLWELVDCCAPGQPPPLAGEAGVAERLGPLSPLCRSQSPWWLLSVASRVCSSMLEGATTGERPPHGWVGECDPTAHHCANDMRSSSLE